jgi:hypothetical protein
LVAAAMLFVTAGSAFAQALDTPSLTLNRAGFFRIDLDVHAGASGTPNGFVIQWMTKAEFDEYGWPSSEYDAATCDFTGTPTLNTDSRSSSFLLGSNGAIQVQMGDLFDETGLYGYYLDALPPGDYAFRVWAEGNGTAGSGSVASATIFASTTVAPECTQGFWKTHPEAWPAGCLPMTLGTVGGYTQAQLLSIFNTPANGNGLISLAHQLITAKLNICNGSNPANIAATITAADALIGGLVVPPVGAGFLAPGTTSALTQTLDDWNNGLIPGVVSCATKSTQTTWGKVKSLYR